MQKLNCLAAALALAGLSCQPLWAHGSLELDAERLMGLSLQELIATPVVTASRQVETRDQTPAQIMVITREQIRERRYQSLADLMRDLPGVDWQSGTKSSQFNQFAVQGYVGPNKLLILMDGVRIGAPAGGNFPVANNLALYMAKQVEVLYGPAAALYGADAVSGVINIITEAGKGPQGSWASLGAGRFGGKEGAFMTGLDTAHGLRLSLGGHWQQADRAPLDRYYPREFTPVPAIAQGQTVIAAHQRQPYVGDTASHSLYARADWAEQFTVGFFRHSFTSLTSTGDPPAMARYQGSSEWQPTSDTFYGRWHFRPAPDVQAQLLVDHSRMELDPKARYNNTFSGYRDSFSYELGKRTGIEQSLNWRINQRQQLQAGLGWAGKNTTRWWPRRCPARMTPITRPMPRGSSTPTPRCRCRYMTTGFTTCRPTRSCSRSGATPSAPAPACAWTATATLAAVSTRAWAPCTSRWRSMCSSCCMARRFAPRRPRKA